MKSKRINVGLAAAVAIALVQSASASVLVTGFFNFIGSQGQELKPVSATDKPADYMNPDYAGVSGWVTSPRQATQGDNGSWDTTYGNGPSTLPTQPAWGYSNVVAAPSQGDGMGRIRAQGSIPGPGQGQPDYSVLSFWITNTGDPLPLDRIYFDLASNPPIGSLNQTVLTKYYMGAFNPAASNTWWNLGTTYGNPAGYGLGATSTLNAYNDYSASLAGLILGTGDTMAFMFSGYLAINPGNYVPNAINVDNVGITAIPEPGSVLGLGCVLASGLMLRSRRKTNRLELP